MILEHNYWNCRQERGESYPAELGVLLKCMLSGPTFPIDPKSLKRKSPTTKNVPADEGLGV